MQDFQYELSVVRMPQRETIFKVTTEEGVLTEQIAELIEKSLNFSTAYGIDLKKTLPDGFANEAQIILVFKGDNQIIAVVLDYGDTVMEK